MTVRLLQLVHGYPPATGGVEFAVRNICERLVAEHGFHVTVLTTDAYTNANFRDGSLPTVPIEPDEERGGVAVRRFPVVTRWAPALRIAQGVAWRARLPGNGRLRTWYQGPISPGLRAAAATLPADVVCAASFPLNHLHYAFGRRDGAPVVLLGSIHPEDRWGYERPNLLRLARRAYATVAHTRAEARWLEERAVAPGRVRVIPEGIDPGGEQPAPSIRARLSIPANAYLVAYIGQLGAHKGIDTLLAALPRLLARVPGAWLAVAGAPTPYADEIARLAAGLPAAARERVRLLGEVTEAEKSSLLQGCDVFASPSRYESFGITTLEAWARSRPVVAGDGPATREVLEGGALGLLVPPGDAGALADALAELAGDPTRKESLGRAGHARLLAAYTLDKVVGEYAELFRAAARERAGSTP